MDLIFVDDEERLTVLEPGGSLRHVGPRGGIRAIGPSLHYDRDGVREIPYVQTDGTDAPALRVVDVGGGDRTTLDPDVMGYVSHGKLGVADLDGDAAPDVVYPDTDKSLARVDRNTPPTRIVKTGTKEGNDAKPWSIVGTIRKRGQQRIYWVDTGSNLKWIARSTPTHIRQPDVDNVGTNANAGIGDYYQRGRAGKVWLGRITGGNDVEMVRPWGKTSEGKGHRIELTTDVTATKAPSGFADVAGNKRPELLFVDTSGRLRRVATRPGPAPYDEAPVVRADGEAVRVSPALGVVPGRARGMSACRQTGERCTVEEATGRCAIGRIVCESGRPTCRSVYDPQPELCNGLDDDCDGRVDNIASSWEDDRFERRRLPSDASGAHCLERNACRCDGRADDHAGRGFASYVDEWNAVCRCQGF
jgi:hypothetical protein